MNIIRNESSMGASLYVWLSISNSELLEKLFITGIRKEHVKPFSKIYLENWFSIFLIGAAHSKDGSFLLG